MHEIQDEKYRKNNYDICTAIDLIKLGMVLERMVAEGSIVAAEADILDAQARSLLAAIRAANNRGFGKLILPPIGMGGRYKPPKPEGP